MDAGLEQVISRALAAGATERLKSNGAGAARRNTEVTAPALQSTHSVESACAEDDSRHQSIGALAELAVPQAIAGQPVLPSPVPARPSTTVIEVTALAWFAAAGTNPAGHAGNTLSIAPPRSGSSRGAIEIQNFDPQLTAAHKPAPKADSAISPGAALSAVADADAAAVAAASSALRGDPRAAPGSTGVALADAAPTPVPQLASGPPAASAAVERGPIFGSAEARASAPAAAEARIDAALHSAAFGPALGLQISALARDGTQEARLHLNPAELGPIMVRIALDGAGARVDFQADLATTRQAIEASLPALAGALRESGLTLTGGGVSQQPSGRQSGDGAGPGDPPGNTRVQAGQGAGDEQMRPLRAAQLMRGLVDLVA